MGRPRIDGSPAQKPETWCHPERRHGARGLCTVCYQAWKKENRPVVYLAQARRNRRAVLARQYGITPEQYEKILLRQGGVCAICGSAPHKKRLHTDHDHETGRVRGLLCWRCNFKLLGPWSKGDRLLRAYEYVKSDFDGRYA